MLDIVRFPLKTQLEKPDMFFTFSTLYIIFLFSMVNSNCSGDEIHVAIEEENRLTRNLMYNVVCNRETLKARRMINVA